MAKPFQIAIDGPAGSGKSSTAKAVAKFLNFRYIDSGAMYRAITYKVLERGIPLVSEKLPEIFEYVKSLNLSFNDDSSVAVNGQDVSKFIRSTHVNQNVSFVAAYPPIRSQVLVLQQQIGKDPTINGLVMDGRDIGTVVFPSAHLKIFLVADIKERAKRRLLESGLDEAPEVIMEQLLERDRIDSERATAPLKKAEDAIKIDTSSITFDQQVDLIISLAHERLKIIHQQ